mgnify:CR=1 FL=1
MNVNALSFAIKRKLSALLTGKSPVPKTCQIDNLRQIYRSVGLHDSSGFFIEIGAFDGERFSNTSFLADQGWVGLYVEPVKASVKKIRRRHALNKVKILNAAVTETKGTATIREMGVLSTTTPESLESVSWAQKAFQNSTTYQVPSVTFFDILNHFNAKNNVDLLVIDVEGSEKTIVQQLRQSPIRPTVVVVELIDNHMDFDEIQKSNHLYTRQMIINMGYQSIYQDHINTIFWMPH